MNKNGIVWGSNPKTKNVLKSYKDIAITNRFDFGHQAPYVIRNFAHLKINRQPNFFKILKTKKVYEQK